MMDFLRRLAPAREADATRAVAVLPSHFASESPLRAITGHAAPAQRLDDDEASPLDDESSPPAASIAFAAQRRPVMSVQPFQAAARAPGVEPTRPDTRKAVSSTHAPAEVPSIDAPDPGTFPNTHDANPARAKLVGPALQNFTVALAADHRLQGATAPPAHPRPALPLSQAILAQRTLQARDDNQVVHVTIGRIDVVANTAPAPAVRHSPTPRQATVTLADYLRGGNGGRR